MDEVYAKPLIQDLEKQTGLKIDALFDVESAKTAGLANKIRAEKARPRADVFWSSALLQTLLLNREGLLQPYASPSASDIPVSFKAKDGAWTGVGVRAHVLVTTSAGAVNRLSFVPLTIENRFGFSNPQFGTASDWMAAWTAREGQKWTLGWLKNIAFEKPRILPGNGDVARLVANGDLSYGWTDSDDFLAQKRDKKPIFLVKTLADNVLVPGSAAMINGAPHPENARKLLDALVSAQNEAALVKAMPGVFSIRHLNEKANWQSGGEDFSFLKGTPPDDTAKWPAAWDKIRGPLAQILAP